jgi:hypothetical protein
MNLSNKSKELEEAAKSILNREEVISEGYVKQMDAADRIAEGLASIKKAWTVWKNGSIPGTRSDIKPAQKELKKYLDDWFKANIK